MPGLFEIASATHVGRRRQGSPNQDSIDVISPGLFRPRIPLLIVADGMGGHAGGALASKIVVETFEQSYPKYFQKLPPRKILEESLLLAHQTVRAAGQTDQQLSDMGSTVVAAILEKQHLYMINVGDSRLFLFRNQHILQISLDQSIVAEKVRQGEITEEEASRDPQKNKLTMSVSARRDEVTPFLTEQALEFNDVILLCTDGLWGSVPINLIRAATCQLKPRQAVKKLVSLANGFGGPDNISVIIARRKGSPLEVDNDNEERDE
jgi:protein phosphatase